MIGFQEARERDGYLTTRRLQNLIRYDPIRGELVATANRKRVKEGKVLGTPNVTGTTLTLGIDGLVYHAHRIAYWLMTGERPERDVVGIDGDATNLEWSNLHMLTEREAREASARRALVARAGRTHEEVPPRPTYSQTAIEKALHPNHKPAHPADTRTASPETQTEDTDPLW